MKTSLEHKRKPRKYRMHRIVTFVLKCSLELEGGVGGSVDGTLHILWWCPVYQCNRIFLHIMLTLFEHLSDALTSNIMRVF